MVLNDEVYSDGVIAFVDKLTPVPITPEILEANGWNKGQRGVKGNGSVVYQVDRRASYEWVNLCHYDKVTHWLRIKFNEE